jgi:hypothetical protein
VELHDYDQGVDLARYGGRDRQVPLLQLIDKHQARQILAMGSTPGYGLSQAVRQGASGLYRYPFDLQTLMH